MSHTAYDAFWRDPLTLERHVGRITAIYDEMLARAPAREMARKRAVPLEKWSREAISP